ncbi:MAG: hypothetical protein KBD01_11610 [Acidobacteria bacterium]|nr:hypothetical protein [Acidobacteriota bacterium]
MPTPSRASGRLQCWWLAGGSELCHFCGQRFACEQEIRCACCDQAICPMCAIIVSSEIVCPDCRAVPQGV